MLLPPPIHVVSDVAVTLAGGGVMTGTLIGVGLLGASQLTKTRFQAHLLH